MQKLHKELSPNIIRLIKSRGMMKGETYNMHGRNLYQLWTENLKGIGHLQDQSIDEGIILK
jgi:hypothetical protein